MRLAEHDYRKIILRFYLFIDKLSKVESVKKIKDRPFECSHCMFQFGGFASGMLKMNVCGL